MNAEEFRKYGHIATLSWGLSAWGNSSRGRRALAALF
jgi:hypothetical protein